MDPKELRKIQIDIRRNIAPDKVRTDSTVVPGTVQYKDVGQRLPPVLGIRKYFFRIRNPK
jgi:hypothetical protein